MLKEAEIIDKNKLILPAMLSDELIMTISQTNKDDLTIFPISDLDLQKAI